MNLDAKYLHHATRDKIVRLRRRDGYRVWRIARECGVSQMTVVAVLVKAGVPLISLGRAMEVRT